MNLHHQSTLIPETSSSQTRCKKPIPRPRTKLPQPVHCQVSSPTSPTEFVFCHRGTQVATTPAALHQGASTLHGLTYSSDYSGDYTGGSGDSGVGDISGHIPSKEALDRTL